MKKLVPFLMLVSATAFAYTESNTTLLPKAGQNEVLITPSLLTGKVKVTSPSGDLTSDISTWGVQGRYMYGLSDAMAIGVETGYSQNDNSVSYPDGTSSSGRSKGIGETAIRLRGNVELGMPTLYYGASYLFGLEKSKSGDVANDGNMAPSQNGVQLEAGVVVPTGSSVKFGGVAVYTIRQDGKYDSVTASGTRSYDVSKGGGLEYRVFAEIENEWHPNVSLLRGRTYSTVSKSNGSESTGSGSDLWAVDLNARYALAQNLEILPRVMYTTPVDKDLGNGNSYGQFDVYYVGAGFRFLF